MIHFTQPSVKVEIGYNLKKLRNHKKLNQEEFARKINLERPAYAAYEEDRAEPDLETLVLICRTFGVRDIIGFISDQKFSVNNPQQLKP